MTRDWLILLGVVVGLLAGKAEEGETNLAREYSITVFDQETGLRQFALASVAQAPDGWLWWSSFGSLGRFNGTQFEDVRVESVAPGRTWTRTLFTNGRGRLWVGAEGRILCMDTNGWRLYGAAEGLPNVLFRSLAEDAQGALWAASAGVIVRQAGARFEAVAGPPGRQEGGFRLALDRGGVLWCSSDVSLNRYGAGGWERVLGEMETHTNRVVGLRAARSGGVYVGFEDDVRLWQGGGWAKVWPRPEGFRSEAVALLEDTRGNLWAGSWRQGLVIYGADGAVRRVTTREGLPNNAVADLCEDSEGNIWLASNGGGLVRFRPLAFHAYGKEAGLEQVANCVAEEASGHIVVGTHGDGLLRWEAGRLSRHPVWWGTNGPAVKEVNTVLRDRHGDLWVGCSEHGLYRLFPGGWERIHPALTGAGTILSLFEDWEGRLWVGTVAGLAMRDGGQFKVFGSGSGLPHMLVQAICQDNAGRIWVCGSGYGLFREEAGHFTRFHIPGLKDNASFRALLAGRDGSLWVGTAQRALCRIQGTNCFVYGEAYGLPEFSIYGILEDSDGYLWLGGSPGAMRIRLRSLDEVVRDSRARIEYQMFDRRDGFPGQIRYGNQPVCCKASDGRIWFAAVRGVPVVDPQGLPAEPSPPRVVIEEVFVNQQPQAGAMAFGKELRLPVACRHVEIRYSATRLGRPERVRFQYRFDRERAWGDAGRERRATLYDPRPGHYQFEVRAADGNEQWGPATVLGFQVPSHYWQTTWFRGVLVMAGAGLAWGIYQWRVKSLEKRRLAQAAFGHELMQREERLRQGLAAELHDSLGQLLQVVRNRAVLAGAGGLPKLAAEHVEAIRESSDEAIQEVRRLVQNLRPYYLEQLGLTRSLLDLIAKTAKAGPLALEHAIDFIDPLVPADKQIHVYRIVQECLANTLRHSHARRAGVVIRHTDSQIELEVWDDGDGLAAQDEHGASGLGLQSIRERAYLLGDNCYFGKSQEGGLRVTIRIPAVTSNDAPEDQDHHSG